MISVRLKLNSQANQITSWQKCISTARRRIFHSRKYPRNQVGTIQDAKGNLKLSSVRRRQYLRLGHLVYICTWDCFMSFDTPDLAWCLDLCPCFIEGEESLLEGRNGGGLAANNEYCFHRSSYIQLEVTQAVPLAQSVFVFEQRWAKSKLMFCSHILDVIAISFSDP